MHIIILILAIFSLLLCLVLFNKLKKQEVCENNEYINELKNTVIEWIDARVLPWPPELDALNTNKKQHIHNVKMCKGKSSYTINKKQTYLCIFDKNGNYYDKNTMMHVILHEFSHVICNQIGHTEQFYTIFKTLMNEAYESTCPHQKKKIGRIYDKDIPIPKNYCSL